MTDVTGLLRGARTIAVVGMSRDPAKAAHAIPRLLMEAGYRVLPVNPSGGEILGLRVHRSLAEIDGPIDIVDVFRPAAEAPRVVAEAIAAGARAVWLQLGISSPEARRLAEQAGIGYVEDACIEVERRRRGITAGA